MTDSDKDIDWSKTTFDGSRREQLRRWRALTLRQRLEALDRLSDLAGRPLKARDKVASSVQEPQRRYMVKPGQHEIALRGCTPTPLASYLKALAVLRLVAEQAGDPEATGCWRSDTFVLFTRLSEDDLFRFFLESYQPTPLIAPWNAGSGFYYQEGKLNEKDPVTGRKRKTGVRDQATEATRILDAIEKSATARLKAYREAIALARSAVQRFRLVKAPENKPSRIKDAFIAHIRNIATDVTLRWIDAALVLADGEPEYPPLLGTGGNDGNLDFTTNFMQNLVVVLRLENGGAANPSRELLQAALVGDSTTSLSERAIGQFSPGSTGSPNGSSGFGGDARINPWDFVLMLEGALLLAASAVRRLESGNAATLSAPFTVRGRLGIGGAAAPTDEDDARGEIWMPLWEGQLSVEEIAALFSEGRAALGSRPARDGLDFARAVARLGVDRGIGAFQRFGFLMRSGKAYLATPISRMAVRRNPQADLIDELENQDWLGRLQRYARDDSASNAFRTVVAQLDAALFALTQRSDRFAVEKVLRQMGRIEAVAARSPKTREAIRPVPELSPQWVRRSDDSSAEFSIALALAGLSLRGGGNAEPAYLGMRAHLIPVTPDGKDWDANSRLACWSAGSLESNLAAVLHRRRLEAERLGAGGEVLRSRAGASLTDVQRFIEGDTDDQRITELLSALACVDVGGIALASAGDSPPPLPAYALLKPFFTSESMLRGLDWLPPDRSMRLPAEIPARLAGGDVPAALRLAWERLRALDVGLPGRVPPSAAGIKGERLLAGLMIPLSFPETGRLLRSLDLAPSAASPQETLDESA